MDFLDKRKIKSALTISDVVQRYSNKFELNKRTIVFLCPFHRDNNLGSCYAYLDAHSFTCQSCHEEADVLKLASAYLNIPLRDMNTLLERIAEDFHFDRHLFLPDSVDDFRRAETKDIELPTDEEYIRLTGTAIIKKVAETKTMVVGEKEFNVVSRYDWLYLRTLAKRDAAAYDKEICDRSRMVWRKLSSLLRKTKTDKELEDSVLREFTEGRLFELAESISDNSIKNNFSKSATVEELLTTIIAGNDKILKKAVLDKNKFEEEIDLRKKIEAREILKEKILKNVKEKM